MLLFWSINSLSRCRATVSMQFSPQCCVCMCVFVDCRVHKINSLKWWSFLIEVHILKFSSSDAPASVHCALVIGQCAPSFSFIDKSREIEARNYNQNRISIYVKIYCANFRLSIEIRICERKRCERKGPFNRVSVSYS